MARDRVGRCKCDPNCDPTSTPPRLRLQVYCRRAARRQGQGSSPPLHRGGAFLQPDAMGLGQAELRGIFDGHDPFALGDLGGQHPEERCLPRRGSSGDEEVGSAPNARSQEFEGVSGSGSEPNQVAHAMGD